MDLKVFCLPGFGANVGQQREQGEWEVLIHAVLPGAKPHPHALSVVLAAAHPAAGSATQEINIIK